MQITANGDSFTVQFSGDESAAISAAAVASTVTPAAFVIARTIEWLSPFVVADRAAVVAQIDVALVTKSTPQLRTLLGKL